MRARQAGLEFERLPAGRDRLPETARGVIGKTQIGMELSHGGSELGQLVEGLNGTAEIDLPQSRGAFAVQFGSLGLLSGRYGWQRRLLRRRCLGL